MPDVNGTAAATTETAQHIVDSIKKEGYLIDLAVSKWSGKARLEAEDLGVEGLTEKELHKLGQRQLVPAEEIQAIGRIEQAARQRIQETSYEFPAGRARFVPVKVLGQLLADLSDLRTKFEAASDDFCKRYAEISDAHRKVALENAKKIAAELKKDAAWLADFEGRLEAAYPTREDVRTAFSIEWTLFQFALPSGLQAKVVAADKALEVARLAEEARRKVEEKVTSFVGEAAVELRRRAGELCQHVADQIEKSGEKITEKSLQPLRELIQQFKAMDFTGDEDFAKTLDTLSKDWIKGKDDEVAKGLRENAEYRASIGKALSSVAERALGESQEAAAAAVERFLKFGNLGRAVAAD